MVKVFLQLTPLLGYSLHCIHVLFKLVCNLYLCMKMMNCSGAIDVNLGYKTFKILVQLGYLEVLKKKSFSLQFS